jgi:hypothetical protein
MTHPQILAGNNMTQNIKFIFNKRKIHACSNPIEILDLECVLGHVTGHGPSWKQKCPYKSAMLDLSEELSIAKGHGASLICPYKSAILNS